MTELDLPIHPRTGLLALGFTKHAAPIWPVAGGAEPEVDDKPDEADETPDDKPDDGKPDDETPDDETKDLGDAGKRALDRMKASRDKANRRAKALEQQLADAGKKDAASQTDAERIRAEIRQETLLERVEDKLEARVAKLTDPEAAEALLRRRHDLKDWIVDGKVDLEALDEAIADLLESRPSLDPAKAEPEKKNRFGGSGDQGPRDRSRPKQLTESDLDRMSPQEIEKAREAGQFADLLAGKQR